MNTEKDTKTLILSEILAEKEEEDIKKEEEDIKKEEENKKKEEEEVNNNTIIEE